MTGKRERSPAPYVLIVVGLAVLTAGMALDDRTGIAMTVAAIVILVAAVAVSLFGGRAPRG